METRANLELHAKEIRINTLRCIANLGVGHVGGSLSIADILSVLYFDQMNIDPKNPSMPNRDRFVLSKGHGGPAVYSALALKGYFPMELLMTLNQANTNLPSHTDRNKTIGVDMTTGSLGQGFSAAVGMATAAQIDKSPFHVFAIVSDGESQEGQIWEAAMFAGHRKLTNLIAVIDRNGFQQGSPTAKTNELDPLDKKFESFGWEVCVVDGHDYAALHKAFTDPQTKPRVVIAQTTKGKGVDFMEGKAEWHHKVPSAEQYEAALEQVGKQ